MAVVVITKDNYDEEITRSEKNVLVDFWAPWCIPCKKMVKLVEELDAEQSEVKMAKMDIEEFPEIAAKLGIMSIPAIVYFKQGKMVKKVSGVQSKKALLKLIAK